MGQPYWRGAAEDEAMQEEHGFLWRALLDTVDVDLTGRRVLDAGCASSPSRPHEADTSTGAA